MNQLVAINKKHPNVKYVAAIGVGMLVFGFWPVTIGAVSVYIGRKLMKD